MSVVRIESFGGEAPSVSGQALPGDLAQRNVNLYAGIREFRPLMEDKDTGVSSAGAKTIYRTQRKAGGGYNSTDNESANWRVSTKELSYVKGQVNDDAKERTYFTTNDASVFPQAFDLEKPTPRRLGVPPPGGLIANIVAGASFTLEETEGAIKEIAKTVAAAIEECIIDPRVDQRGARYKDYRPSNGVPKAATLTPLAGPYSNYGMGPTEEIASVLPEPYNEMHWLLYAVRPSIELRSIFGEQGMVDLGVIVSNIPAATNSSVTSYQAAVTIHALPFCLVPDKPDPANPGKLLLESRLRAIKNPKDGSPLFDDKEIISILEVLVDGSRVDRFAKNLREEFDQVVKEFSEVVFNTTQADLNVPLTDVGPAPVRPVEPTRPGVSEYPGNGDEMGDMDPQWVKYYEDLKAYNAALAKYNTDKQAYDQKMIDRGLDAGKLATAQQGLASRVNALRNRAISLSQQIEAKVLRVYQEEMLNLENLEASLVNGFGGAPALFGGVDDDRVKEARFYVATHVTDWGEESAPSPVTTLLEPTQYDTVEVTFPAPPADRFIQKVRLYRSNAGTTNAAFQFVAELDAPAANFVDGLKAAELGEGLATTTWAEPPERLVGLVGMPNGIMAGFFDNTVCFCEPYAPYAWPVEYQITTEHPIVGLAAFGQTLFVGTTGSPYFVSGSDSASMSALKMDSNQSCVSRRSIVAVQGGVLYASPDGLCLADGRGIQVVSQGLFTREDWQALKPETILGAEHEGIYFMSYEGNGGGVFCFDLPSKKLTRLAGILPSALFVDRLNDVLYYASTTGAQTIRRLYGGTTRRTGLWKSGRNPFPQHATLAWAQVEGFPTTQEPVLIRLYGDNYFIDYRGDVYEAQTEVTVRQVNGQTVSKTEVTGWRRRRDGVLFVPGTPEHTAINYTVKLTDSKPVRLPFGRWRDHEIEVESRSRVTRVTLAGSLEELKAV